MGVRLKELTLTADSWEETLTAGSKQDSGYRLQGC